MQKTSKEFFAERLRYLRKENLGLSIFKVAEKSEISERAWINYEKGSRIPRLDLFFNLEKSGILLDLNYLVYGRVSPNYLSEEEILIISKIREKGIGKDTLLLALESMS